MALNPLAYTEKVVQSFLRYQLTTYSFADPRFNARMRELLSLDTARETPLLRGPYVSLSRAFEVGAAVEDLLDEGLFHRHMRHLIPFPNLYGHQEKAIRAISSGKTTLISTGTGSGKTECFLYPVISRCLELRDENTAPGICAVLVYPMNALAEDQLGRLRGLLAGTGISFGMYVGKTPNLEAGVTGVRLASGSSRATYEAALAEAREQGEGATVHPTEEVCSREAMRKAGGQPRILLTNVNQLELLLTRQADVELFDRALLDFLVFDETHTFTGAQGAETACLIRRLRSFCGRSPEETVCVATSATIVDEGNPDAARDFASRFFGVVRDDVATVHEIYEREDWGADRVVPAPPQTPMEALRTVLAAVDAEDPDEAVRSAWESLTGASLGDRPWDEALHLELARNALLFQAASLLETPRALGDLIDDLGKAIDREVTEAELILWLTLGAAARSGDRPLVRPVVHAFIRGVPGGTVTFDTATDEPVLHLSAEEDDGGDDEAFRLRVFTCTTCGQHYFEHSLGDFEFTGAAFGGGQAEGDQRFWPSLDVARGGVRILLTDRLVSAEEDEESEENENLAPIYLCQSCGSAHEEAADACLQCGSAGKLLKLLAVRQKEKQPGVLTSCTCCGAIGGDRYGRYREPIKPVRATNVADIHVLAQEMVQHAQRKRLLVFADNRQDAAFQAGWMRDHARRYRLRAMIANELQGGDQSIGDLVFSLDRLLEEDDSLSRVILPEVWGKAPKEEGVKAHRDERKYLLRIHVLREITMALKQQIGLEPWGRLKIRYEGLSESSDFVQAWSVKLGIPAKDLTEGVAAYLDILRRNRLLLDRNRFIFSKIWGDGAPEVMDGYLPRMQGVPTGLKLMREGGDNKGRIKQWISPTGHRTLAVEIAKKWGLDDEDLHLFLKELWKLLVSVGILAPVTLRGMRDGALPGCAGAHQIDADRLLLCRNHGTYRCTTCRRRSVRSTPGSKCLAWRCSGTLEFLQEDADNYDLAVLDGDYEMLRAREHTAMVPSKEREEIEEIFKGKSDTITALVCTQTLELGVDIGALDAVLMRNVPPLPANYWQRAGRAGRRHRMAVNLTYCRPVSHDRAYFSEPLKMLGGLVEPPSFNLSNGLMVGKHVRAGVLTRLHQLGRESGGLGEAERVEVGEALHQAFPGRIREYLFDQGGAVRTQPRDVRPLHTVVTKHQQPIETTVRAAFQQGWPAEDSEVVEPVRLAEFVLEMTDELEGVIRRLDRRLRWALRQMDQLEAIRRQQGALDDQQKAIYRRCERLIEKYKGVGRRGRSEAEGFDDTVTYSVLAAEGYLPGYGLEVGSVLGMAEMPRAARGMRDFDLPRPPSIAIREYVPGNLIYANGHRFVTRSYHFEADQQQQAIGFDVFPDRQAVQPSSGGPAGGFSALRLVSVPITDATLIHTDRISDEEENRFQMAVEIYGREMDQHAGGTAYLWGERPVQLRRGLRLQLVNVGSRATIAGEARVGYPVCRVCGQSVSPFSSERQREDFQTKHREWCNQDPQQVGFHADLTVDALSLPACSDRKEAFSLAECLRFAAASILDMDRDDLQVLVIGNAGTEALDAVIYDPMPGGSGLLQHLCARFPEVVAEARRLADECPSKCADSCIDCFRTYRNAFYHEHLDRTLMRERLADWGDTLEISHEIPPRQPAVDPEPDQDATNVAERRLKRLLKSAGFPDGQWQRRFPLPRPLNSTTPDVTYDHPDGEPEKLFIYLDGLSDKLHGNPETAQRDREIRAELRADGHEVLEITAVDLDDQRAMTRHFRRLARWLVGRDEANRVKEEAEGWFSQANEPPAD